MLIRTDLDELALLGEPLHLALGVFDGVHLGHQEVIARAVMAARVGGGLAGLLTFDPHPCKAVRPEMAPPSLLATLDHKARIVRDMGIRLFIPLHFDAAFGAMEAGEFLDRLTAAPVRTLVVGEDWRFGRHRAGDVRMLENESGNRGFRLEKVAPVMFEGERISSTRIRQAIRDGNLDGVSRMLGRPYSICGEVLHGDQLGRTIGVPTANVFTGDAQLPPDGVWAVRVSGDAGEVWNGMANLGSRPTVGGGHHRLEVHLFKFSGDLYGKNLDVAFVKFLRSEEKFPSLDALRQQIEQDAISARLVLIGGCENPDNPA